MNSSLIVCCAVTFSPDALTIFSGEFLRFTVFERRLWLTHSLWVTAYGFRSPEGERWTIADSGQIRWLAKSDVLGYADYIRADLRGPARVEPCFENDHRTRNESHSCEQIRLDSLVARKTSATRSQGCSNASALIALNWLTCTQNIV